MKITIPTTIKKMEYKKRVARAWCDASGDAHTEEEALGWAILLEGSLEWLFVGEEKPDFAVGDKVRITIETMR